MMLLLLAVLIAMAVVMTVGWTVQRALNNGGWTDVFWTYGTGAACALAALVPFGGNAAPTWRQALVAVLAAIWALRLGTYVALRVAKGPEDARYSGLRREWGAKFQQRMFGLLIVQAPAAALLAISVLMAARTPAPMLRAQDIAGLAILILAIVGEAVADEQMKRFKADPANKGQVCDQGLWGWSRHPNYLFEALGWFAYPAIAIDLAHPSTFASVIAPLLMFAILRYGTGVPPLEAAMVQSKGDAYRRYQARVSALLPRPPKKTTPEERAA
jgi:steroid 5-alpha reductase family enzyme